MVQRRSTASCRSKAWTPGQSIVRAQCCEYGTVPYRNVHDEDREGGACPSATVDQNGRDLFFFGLCCACGAGCAPSSAAPPSQSRCSYLREWYLGFRPGPKYLPCCTSAIAVPSPAPVAVHAQVPSGGRRPLKRRVPRRLHLVRLLHPRSLACFFFTGQGETPACDQCHAKGPPKTSKT